MTQLLLLVTTVFAGGDPGACRFDWLPTGGLPGLSAPAYASTVWDPDGGGPQEPLLVVGGSFNVAGDVKVDGVAAWDGRAWHALGRATGYVRSLAVHEGELIAGEQGGSAGAVVRRWDGSAWLAVGPRFTGFNPSVSALATYHGELIAAGAFSETEGTETNNIARWDGTKWNPLGSGLTLDAWYASVTSLAVYGDELIAGGYFDTAGGIPAKGLARWNGTDWSPVGGDLTQHGRRGTAYALFEYQGDLIVGGYFDSAAGVPVANVARWDGSAWHAMGGIGFPEAFATYHGELIAGQGGWVLRWDGVSWHALGDDMRAADPGEHGCGFPVVVDRSVCTFSVYQDTLIAGGEFRFVGAKSARHIAQWNGVEWNPIGSGMSIVPGVLAVHDGKLIAGGGFLTAPDNTRAQVTVWDGEVWRPLGDGVWGQVRAITSFRGEMILGGEFWVPEDPAVQYIARWDGDLWAPLGSGIDSSDCSPVSDLLVFGNELIVGGEFSRAGDTEARNIARWNGAEWLTLGEGIAGRFGSMTIYNGKLIVGGEFQQAGGRSARNIAAWDGTSWEPLGNGLDSFVRALAVLDGRLIAFWWWNGGDTYMAQWDGASWTQLGGGVDYGPAALAVFNGELFVAGDFTRAGGVPAESIARWDGTAWHAVPGGMLSWVRAMTVYHGELIVGGSAELADGSASANWSRWGPTGPRCDFDSDGDVDGSDYVRLHACLSQPVAAGDRASAPPECLCTFNGDGDGDIDLADVARFQNTFDPGHR